MRRKKLQLYFFRKSVSHLRYCLNSAHFYSLSLSLTFKSIHLFFQLWLPMHIYIHLPYCACIHIYMYIYVTAQSIFNFDCNLKALNFFSYFFKMCAAICMHVYIYILNLCICFIFVDFFLFLIRFSSFVFLIQCVFLLFFPRQF